MVDDLRIYSSIVKSDAITALFEKGNLQALPKLEIEVRKVVSMDNNSLMFFYENKLSGGERIRARDLHLADR